MREPTGIAVASARTCHGHVGLVGRRTIQGIVQLSGLLARAAVIVGLKMQGYVEYEMIGDLLGKDTRQRHRPPFSSVCEKSWTLTYGITRDTSGQKQRRRHTSLNDRIAVFPVRSHQLVNNLLIISR